MSHKIKLSWLPILDIQSKLQNKCKGYEVIQYETSVMDTLVDIFNDNHIHDGLFGIEGKYMPVDTYETLCDTLDERFNFTSIHFAKLRAVKREDELELMRKAD